MMRSAQGTSLGEEILIEGIGKEDDWDPRQRGKSGAPRQEIQPVGAGHFQIQDHQIRQGMELALRVDAVPQQVLDGLLAIGGSLHPEPEARLLDSQPEEGLVIMIVFDQQQIQTLGERVAGVHEQAHTRAGRARRARSSC